jgi:hypothetical protein
LSDLSELRTFMVVVLGQSKTEKPRDEPAAERCV